MNQDDTWHRAILPGGLTVVSEDPRCPAAEGRAFKKGRVNPGVRGRGGKLRRGREHFRNLVEQIVWEGREQAQPPEERAYDACLNSRRQAPQACFLFARFNAIKLPLVAPQGRGRRRGRQNRSSR